MRVAELSKWLHLQLLPVPDGDEVKAVIELSACSIAKLSFRKGGELNSAVFASWLLKC